VLSEGITRPIKIFRKFNEHKLTPPTYIVGRKPSKTTVQKPASSLESNKEKPVNDELVRKNEIEERIRLQLAMNRQRESYANSGQNRGRSEDHSQKRRREGRIEDNIGSEKGSPQVNRKKRHHEGHRSYADVARPNRLHNPSIWGEKEIRLVAADPQTPLNKNVWRQLEAPILQGHGLFLRLLKSNNEPVVPFLIQRIYYNQELSCGIIEVGSNTDAATLRDRFIPILEIPIVLKALVKTDNRIPVVSAFTPQVYQAYSTDEYVDLMKIVNPILESEPFEVIQTLVKDNGRQFFFKTTDVVLEFIRENSFIIQHALGQTIFNRRIEYEMNAEVYTLPPLIPIPAPFNDLPMDEAPIVNDKEDASNNVDNGQDDANVSPDEVQMNDPQLPQKNLYDYNDQDLDDLLGPNEGNEYADAADNPLDYNLLNDDEEDLLS
jgi:hypothetical protein